MKKWINTKLPPITGSIEHTKCVEQITLTEETNNV
jgi:hypothetical protein